MTTEQFVFSIAIIQTIHLFITWFVIRQSDKRYKLIKTAFGSFANTANMNAENNEKYSGVVSSLLGITVVSKKNKDGLHVVEALEVTPEDGIFYKALNEIKEDAKPRKQSTKKKNKKTK